MTILAGRDGNGWTVDDTYTQAVNTLVWTRITSGGESVLQSGTAVTAYFYNPNWDNSTKAKVVVYENAGTRVKLGESSDILASGGTGLRSAPITLSRALVASEIIFIAVISDGWLWRRSNSTGGTFKTAHNTGGTYASVTDPLTETANIAPPEFLVYLDGTIAGSILRQMMQRAG